MLEVRRVISCTLCATTNPTVFAVAHTRVGSLEHGTVDGKTSRSEHMTRRSPAHAVPAASGGKGPPTYLNSSSPSPNCGGGRFLGPISRSCAFRRPSLQT